MTGDPPVLRSPWQEVDDFWEWDALARRQGWTEGLPLAPPTEERVVEILARLGRDPGESVGEVPPLGGSATYEQLAIQCAMAGCPPEFAPAVVTAVEALLTPSFNLAGVQATTNPCAPLAVVSGPAAGAPGFNTGHGAFDAGYANVSIGRAVRLVLRNIGGARQGETDMATLGQPAKFSACVAEGRDGNPWPPFHTQLGLPEAASAVTVFACCGPYPALLPDTAEHMLAVLCESLPSTAANYFHAAGQILLVLSPKPARVLAEAGFDVPSLRARLFEQARWEVGDLRRRGLLGGTSVLSTYWGYPQLAGERPDLDGLADADSLPLFRRPEDVLVLVTGASNQWWGALLTGWGAYGGEAVARELGSDALTPGPGPS